ncbi:MAG: hypothetical protein ACI4U9_00120 [Clostridia bacterium]
MGKRLQILCAILGIVILLSLVFFMVNYKYETFENSNMKETKSAVVVKVDENSLSVMGVENTSDLFTVSYANEINTEFKQGQEILIYFDGMVLSSFPGQIPNVGKIEIVKEESSVSIPDDVLRFYYSSRNNVNVSVSELTNTNISLTIIDTNELPYNYSHSYTIYKKVKNEDYTGIGYKIGEDTEHSTSGYTRNRS